MVAGVRTYSGAEGKPVAEKSAKTGTTGTTLTWLFSNLEGTVDVQTVANATGVTTRVLRDPYGAPIGGSNGVWSSGTGYMNKPVTASTGLTTVGARTYDPVLGKFLSVDPVIDTNLPQQNTGYTYSGNNPTTYMDPSGLRYAFEMASPGPTAWKYDAGFAVGSKFHSMFGQKWTFEKPKLYNQKPPLVQKPKTVTPPSPWAPRGGPYIAFNPDWKPPVPELGASGTVCFILCVGYERGIRGSHAINVSAGLRVELTGGAGVSTQESEGAFGPYVVGECSATAGIGASASIGAGLTTKQDRPDGYRINTTSSGGIRFGGGGGCSAGLSFPLP